jgi:hypothetical protein
MNTSGMVAKGCPEIRKGTLSIMFICFLFNNEKKIQTNKISTLIVVAMIMTAKTFTSQFLFSRTAVMGIYKN